MYMYKLSMLTKLMAVHSNYMESVRNKFPVFVAGEHLVVGFWLTYFFWSRTWRSEFLGL